MARPKEAGWSDPNIKESASQQIIALERQLATATPFQRRRIEKSLQIYRDSIDGNIK